MIKATKSSTIPKSWYMIIFIILVIVENVFGGALKLNNDNFDKIIGNNELVFVNFYADWCRFSNMLAPTWDETADKVHELYPEEGKVVIAKIDCDSETSIAARFHITKYPTLKLFRNGQSAKKEYRGQRSVDAISNFITEQLQDPIIKIKSLDELKGIEDKKRNIIGYFDQEEGIEFENFQKLARHLKDDCVFYIGFGDTVRSMHPPSENIVAFKSSTLEEDEAYKGSISNSEELNIWATHRCIPLVREITFQNAEELTEEGLPFLILFHNAEDTDIVRKYNTIIQTELLQNKQTVNFLTADGDQFAHPLHHLGKAKKDLPLIAIDSFRHMYLFPDIQKMSHPGVLKTFLENLSSGKLHREFHYGPDPVSDDTTNQIEDKSGDSEGRRGSPSPKPRRPTTPPESTFKKLGPSKNRYTLLDKDEL